MDVPQLVRRAADRELTEDDLTSFLQSRDVTRHDLFDALVAFLARGFVSRELSFAFCDTAVNEIFGLTNYDASEFTWAVYGAFEEGEYHHAGDSRDLDPAEVYARPLLEKLVASHGDSGLQA